MGRAKKPWQIRIQKYIKPVGEHWVWTGRVANAGTKNPKPQYSINGKFSGSVDLLLWRGAGKPDCASVVRVCDKELCINPDHQQPGKAGKLSHKNVKEILSKWGTEKVTQTSLAKEYGCTKQMIELIVNGKFKKGGKKYEKNSTASTLSEHSRRNGTL